MRPEELAVAPSWVPHGARTKDVGCYKVDISNPPRKPLLDYAAAQVAPVGDEG